MVSHGRGLRLRCIGLTVCFSTLLPIYFIFCEELPDMLNFKLLLKNQRKKRTYLLTSSTDTFTFTNIHQIPHHKMYDPITIFLVY